MKTSTSQLHSQPIHKPSQHTTVYKCWKLCNDSVVDENVPTGAELSHGLTAWADVNVYVAEDSIASIHRDILAILLLHQEMKVVMAFFLMAKEHMTWLRSNKR